MGDLALTRAYSMSIMRTSFDAASFVGCTQAFRGIAQSGSAPALGAGCREFESLYPDQFPISNPAWLTLRFDVIKVCGGRSSVGRAPDCDSGGRGFNPHRSPHYS